METPAFAGSSLSAVGIISTVGLSMFPFILPSSVDPKSSLTVFNASSSHLTFVMLVVTVVFAPADCPGLHRLGLQGDVGPLHAGGAGDQSRPLLNRNSVGSSASGWRSALPCSNGLWHEIYLSDGGNRGDDIV